MTREEDPLARLEATEREVCRGVPVKADAEAMRATRRRARTDFMVVSLKKSNVSPVRCKVEVDGRLVWWPAGSHQFTA